MDPKTGILYAYGYAHGRAWCVSTGFSEVARAIEIAREIEHRKLGGQTATDVRKRVLTAQALTLAQACEQLRGYDTRENAKPRTRSYHVERCASLMNSLGKDLRLVDLDRPKLLAYFTKRLEGATLKQRHTAQKDYKVLRLVLRINKEMGLWEGDLDEYSFDFFRKSSKYYAPGETWLEEIGYVDALIAEISSGRSLVRRSKRNGQGREWLNRAPVHVDRKLHVLSYVNLGLRRSELDTIYEHHINLEQKTVAVNYPKNAVPDDAELLKGKTIEAKRVLGLNPVMIEVFSRKMRDCDPTKPIFEPWPSAGRDLRAAWKRARQNLIRSRVEAGDVRGAQRLEMRLPHTLCLTDLRRTFCSQMAQSGVPLQRCADIMGHVSDAMVKRVYRRCAPATLQASMEMMPAMALPI